MNKSETFESFLNNPSALSLSLSLEELLINLIFGTIMSLIIRYTYIYCTNTVSDKKTFANQFPLLLLITMFIITIVKSSLALSLGLVGALSIVRFRTAIKEPSELIYLFFCIGIGLGLGANQRFITIISFLFIISFIWLYFLITQKNQNKNQNILVTITTNGEKKLELQTIIKLFEQYSNSVELIRFDETKEQMEVHFNTTFDGIDNLNLFRNSLFKLDNKINLTVLENKNLN